MVYDIPIRTGRKIATATLLRLAREVPNIVGLKDAAGNPGETAALIAEAPDGFEVYSGDDGMTLPLLAVGAVGVVGVATHWTGGDHQELFDLLGEGRPRRRPAGERPAARELRLRDRRRRAQPDPDQGDAAASSGCRSARPACRWAPLRLGSRTAPGEVLAEPRAVAGRVPRPPRWLTSVAQDRSHHLPRRSRRDRAQLHGHRAGRPPAAHRLRADVPRRRHARHRPRPARLHLPARERRPHRGLRRHPRPRGPRRRRCSFLLRELSFPIYGSALTLGLARNRIEEAGLLDRTELITVTDGERRTIGPFDVEFIPVTHSVPHAHRHRRAHPAGRHPALRRLQARPHAGRRPPHRPGPHRRASPRHRGHPAADVRLAPTPRSTATRRASGRSAPSCGRSSPSSAAGGSSPPASPATSTASSRSPTPPSPPAGSWPRSACRCTRTCAWPATSGCSASPTRRWSTSRTSTGTRPAKVCVISTGSQGEPMSALALLAPGENRWLKVGDHDTVILSSHAIPGNEFNVNRVIDGLLRAGAEVVHTGVADVHATGHAQADELKTLLVDRPARVVRADPRRVPPPGRPRQAGPAHGRAAATTIAAVRGRRRADAVATTASRPRGGCRPATSTSTASSATSARACCATAGCWPRRAWSSSSSPSTSKRQGAHRSGDHHPGLGVRPGGRGPARRGLRPGRRGRRGGAGARASATSRRSSGRCAAPPASS